MQQQRAQQVQREQAMQQQRAQQVQQQQRAQQVQQQRAAGPANNCGRPGQPLQIAPFQAPRSVSCRRRARRQAGARAQ